MATDKDVLGKADALLRRHAPGGPATGSETGAFPVLTDLIEPPGVRQMAAPGDDAAEDVFARVMVEVEGRIVQDLEKRLAQHVAPQVHAAVAAAMGDLRRDLSHAIAKAVEEALARRPVK